MKILITAGPTREYIDPIRFISNPASGTLGFLIAEKAKKNGHNVIVVAGPCNIPHIKGIKIIPVESALEMQANVEKYFPSVDAVVMSAAVSDWKPEKTYSQKIKRKKKWNLALITNPDILKSIVAKKKKNQVIIGFALESENILKNAKKKLRGKNVNLLVANTISNLGKTSKKSKIFLLFSDGRIKKIYCTKNHLASLILKETEKLVAKK